jgi:hypothetical protein
MQSLKFYSRGMDLCVDFEAHSAGTLRFIGRRHDSTIGHEGRDEHGNKFKSGGWPSTDAPQTVPARAEYAKACQDKSLWPADQATADYCGVPFDPDFGGEHASVRPAKSK